MKYYIFLVLAVLFWSGNFIFARMVSSSIEPMELSFFRWFFVLVLFAPYILFNSKRLYSALKKDSLILILLGALGIAGFNTFLYYGLETTSATNALLINSGTPIFIIVLSSLILRTHITLVQFFGVVLSTLGVIYLILKGNVDSLSSLEFSNGDLWVVVSSISWALYSIFLKFKPKDISIFDFFSLTLIFGVLILYLVFIYQGYSFDLSFVENDEVVYSLAYMVIFPSILSYYFWNSATVGIGANKAGQFTHLMPIFGSVLAFFFLGERLESYHLMGMVLIAIGIYLSMFLKKV